MKSRTDSHLRPHVAVLLVGLAAALMLSGCSGAVPTAPPVVAGPPLSAVIVTPPVNDTLMVGGQLQLAATALDTLGAVLGTVTFNWSSSNTAIATVSSTGKVTGVGEGVAKIIAEASGKRDSVAVSVFVQAGWYLQGSNTSANLNGVFFQADGRNGWAVGDGGRIIRTADAGATWTTQTSNTSFNLQSVWFTSANEGWVVGNAATVVHTTNGGTTWTVTPPGASENLNDLMFATPDTGWVVGASGVVLRTFNHGSSWQKVYPTATTMQSVSFTGTRDGWAVGDGGIIVGTHDRGLTWFIVQPAITIQPLNSVWRRSESEAWAAGGAGLVPRTRATVDSTAWELQNAGASNTLEGVCYPASQLGYAVGFTGGGTAIVLRTDDAGISWQSQTAGTTFRLNDVYFIDALHGWAVGNNGTIIHTSRGGL